MINSLMSGADQREVEVHCKRCSWLEGAKRDVVFGTEVFHDRFLPWAVGDLLINR